jgi:hypothetical protein
LQLGLSGHLVGFIDLDNVKFAARRIVAKSIVEPVEGRHIAFLAADMVQGAGQLVGEGHRHACLG